jgi:hypothetical protein
MIVIVPDIGGFEAHVFGRYWIGLDIPRHLMHFTEETAGGMLKKIGFKIDKIRPSMFPSSFSESLIMMLPAKWRFRVLHSRWARFLFLLALIPSNLSYFFGNRGVLEITAVKPGRR